jgi:hypothetical protein
VCLVWTACALALVAPANAAAKPGVFVKHKSLHLHLKPTTSKGYGVSIDTSGHRQVQISVEKGDFLAQYKALGRVSRKGIEADFGRFGQISLRFRSKSGPKQVTGLPLPPPLRDRCRGRRPVRETGVFVGNVRFVGEHGYTHVIAHRLKGNVARTYKRVCRHHRGLRVPAGAAASKGKDRPEAVILTATAQEHGASRIFTTASIADESDLEKKGAEGFSVDLARLAEKVEGVAIVKLVFLLEGTTSLVASPRAARPVTVDVTPPQPFAGTGSYLEEQRQPPSWTGTLGVRLPGSGLVPLAGPEFEAGLCRAISEREFERCDEQEQSFQGSGSHSQPLALARLSSLRYRWNSSSSAGSTLYTWSGSGKWRLRTSLP